jgi:LacI family transcriptional regulator
VSSSADPARLIEARRALEPEPGLRPTLRDVARIAGVSLGTASRVLNRYASVKSDLRLRVEKAIVELGYRPDAVAQSMRRGATQTIGVVIRDITVPVLAGFVKSAQDVLYEAGYTLVLASSDDRHDRELDLLNGLLRRRVDGFIMTTVSERDPDLLNARAAVRTPVVLLDRELPASFDAVLVAHREGMRQAVSHLLDLGHRRIALLTGSEAVRPGLERVLGYQDAFRERALELDPDMIRARSFTPEFAYVESSMLLGRKRPPTAIIAGGIAMLAGVLRAIRAHSLAVGEDVSVVGASDSDLAELATPPITVVRWSYAEIGRAAAQLLLDRIERDPDHAPRRIKFPSELVIRASCVPPRRHD